ncbi:hypothetical protein DL765_002841 [Monosporascus sp. GIB2]|nr:hypothetical protein DL765_002841 [Monosporascus sp. GIB2]
MASRKVEALSTFNSYQHQHQRARPRRHARPPPDGHYVRGIILTRVTGLPQLAAPLECADIVGSAPVDDIGLGVLDVPQRRETRPPHAGRSIAQRPTQDDQAHGTGTCPSPSLTARGSCCPLPIVYRCVRMPDRPP